MVRIHRAGVGTYLWVILISLRAVLPCPAPAVSFPVSTLDWHDIGRVTVTVVTSLAIVSPSTVSTTLTLQSTIIVATSVVPVTSYSTTTITSVTFTSTSLASSIPNGKRKRAPAPTQQLPPSSAPEYPFCNDFSTQCLKVRLVLLRTQVQR